MRLRQLLSIFFLCNLALLTACSSSDDNKTLAEQPPAEEMYEQATAALQTGAYNRAVSTFQDIERTYPYSPLATKAKLMAGYAQYRNEEYDAAISSLDRFIKFHPGNKDVAYAYYLKALCYYEQITDVGRDQSMTERAQAALKEVFARFPESEYARDAKLKIDLVRDHLAGKEMEVGRFYLKQNQPIAAINRFKEVINKYETTAHTAEALHRLVESYLMLGVVPEAQKYAAVLGANFPGSKWYQQSYDLMQTKGFKIPQVGKENDGSIKDYLWPFGDDA